INQQENSQEIEDENVAGEDHSVLNKIGPHGPVERAGGLAKIFVHNSTHEEVLDGHVQCQALDLAGFELAQIAADVGGAPVGGFAAGLPGIVLANVQHVTFDFAAIHPEHLVFQNGGVVVQVPFE